MRALDIICYNLEIVFQVYCCLRYKEETPCELACICLLSISAEKKEKGFLNPTIWLMDPLDEVTRSRGDITIGGISLVIALSFGIDLTVQPVMSGSTQLDLKDFHTMGWITTEVTADGYVWKSGEPSHAPESSTQADVPLIPPYAHQLYALRGDIGSLRTEVQLLHQFHSDSVAAMQCSVDVMTSQHQAFQATFGGVPQLLRDLRAWHISQGWTPDSFSDHTMPDAPLDP
ncbi:hypothetical protein BVRB_5g106420 [Beta vulgaris subsp. vulgaris]|nr:hypothetical protein BVRB_5g106420 [Beta vulgaris subsp. vulgaris]